MEFWQALEFIFSRTILPEGGFHICDAGTAEEDSVTLNIALEQILPESVTFL